MSALYKERKREIMDNKDEFWLAYKHAFSDKTLSLRFEGFGFEGDIEKLYELPRYEEYCELFNEIALKILEIEE